MQIPVYVISGFLDSGKTTLLNRLLNGRQYRGVPLLVIQFEAGEEEFTGRKGCDVMVIPKRTLDRDPEQVAEQIEARLNSSAPREVWVEWNGVTPLALLQDIFRHPALYRLCRLEKIIHMLDAETLESLLGKTGGALPEQIAGCDFAVARGLRSGKDYARVKRLLRNLNPGVKLLRIRQAESIYSEIYRKKSRPVNAFSVGLLLFVGMYLLAARFVDLSQTPVNTVINIYLGIMLQAVPFLLIGVMISSIIQVFVPQEYIERRFPKNPVGGMLTAVLLGFCLPVCDCASIPIFRSMVRKGVPLAPAVTFMTVTPVVNPVVMLSTYYAFSGNLRIVAARAGLGVIAAVLIGLWFSKKPARADMLPGVDGLMCSCGCYEGVSAEMTLGDKLGLFIRHSQAEFFNVGKYLMLGALVAALFQTGIRSVSFQSGIGFDLALLLMMVTAFLLSLCSSSDAVIARSFASSFPMGAVMGFLVFGPMIDVKNVIMLSGSFSKKFVAALFAAAFVTCYIVVYLFGRFAVGG
ncbi:hypothetical protein SAMN02745823_00819 [Sporobacter termitidis DSM 10068]|uniref:CobW/HypB/UreG nucleotide-binding domain-containing protein n=1 Tax=Sporobacter termitidis DSM 10068 TaxID=1123282 RepID=A0A1M5VGQ6_9FIRM|nr:permease [Sporobacter termitidis]SHH74381.1 hypothetical protein SAMN02745823_00819 [Sporobacter termitidis DSM 10068]